MIKRLTRGAIIALTAVMLLLPFNKANAGIPVGSWKSHPAYNDATCAVKAFNMIFVLSEGAIYIYDPSDEGLYTMDKTGGLSDTDIAAMEYCHQEDALLLVYSNGNIDILYRNETIYNFTDLKNNDLGTLSINEVRIIGDKAYISTSIGLVIFDIKKREIKNTYRFDYPVNTSILFNDTIICSTLGGIYIGSTEDNLLDKSEWSIIPNYVFKQFFVFDSILTVLTDYNNIWTVSWPDFEFKCIKENVFGLSFSDDKLIMIQDTLVTVYSSYSDSNEYIFNKHINSVFIDNDNWWVCQGLYGLNMYQFVDDKPVCKISSIKPNSPRRNWFHSVSWPDKDRLLIVGGCHNYNNLIYPGTLMIYENDRWFSFDEKIDSITGVNFENLTEAAQDPMDRNHIFVGSAGQGLYEFKDHHFKKLHTWNNSGLTSILNDNDYNRFNFVRVSALQFDKNGNLWMVNNEVDTIIKVMQPDGSWFGLYYPELAKLPTLKQMKFDDNGFIWINSSRHKPGIVCINTNSTIKDSSDDIIRFSGSIFKNQDGISEEIYDIFCYDFDLNGDMWICTNTGIFVYRNADYFINDLNPVFERIKITRNDNNALADYLFNGVYTTAIYIDQGNRKWIGTLNDGVFLLSSDGTQTLEHFTVNNSPLPSNNILSITENGQNGSLFFGTSLGMIEYGGQARDPETNLCESNILVYPNPIKPEYEGFVTITGLTSESTIRIINNSGKLVNQGISNGGSYSWNLNDMNGNQVPSGIYHAIITNKENSKSESKNITVIR